MTWRECGREEMDKRANICLHCLWILVVDLPQWTRSGYHSVASVSLSSSAKGKCGTGSVDDCPGTVCGSVGDFGRTGDLETGGSEAGSGYSVVLDLCRGGCSICGGESLSVNVL